MARSQNVCKTLAYAELLMFFFKEDSQELPRKNLDSKLLYVVANTSARRAKNILIKIIVRVQVNAVCLCVQCACYVNVHGS